MLPRLMSNKTTSESLFEEFCSSNKLAFERIPEGVESAPDYRITLHGTEVYVEVKQIDEDAAFTSAYASRTPGSHIRAKINQARDQVRSATGRGAPTILLVYNNLDPVQAFGTEQHDFIAAMYGDLTVLVSRETGKISDSFHGRNKSFREGKNDTFSAVGWLHRERSGVAVHLYQNMHARVSLDYDTLPACISYNRVEFSADEDV